MRLNTWVKMVQVNPYHDMIVIAHDCIGAQINREYGAEQFDAINDPLAAVFKVITRDRVGATQEGSTYTS